MPNQIRSFLPVIFLLLFSLCGKSQTNYSVGFDGADDYGLLPVGLVSSLTGDYTIEAWVYWRGGGSYQRVFDFGSGMSQYLYLTPSHGTYQTCFVIQNGGGEQVVTAGTTISTNTWHHMAFVYTSSNTTGKLFVDGTLIASNAAMTQHASSLGSTTQNYIGKSQWADPYFNGMIDELRISNSARYSANFTPQQNNFTVDANTLALYHFDEGSGQTIKDATSSHLDGTMGPTASVESSDPSWETTTILPVGLTNFTGEEKDGRILLTWQTATEENNKGFYIERSKNGVGFQTVGFVAGAGNSFAPVNYSFTDPAVMAPALYYRLRQVDVDGKATFSRIILVHRQLNTAGLPWGEALLSPVPVNGSLTIHSVKEIKYISIYNSLGQVVLARRGNAATIDVSALHAGSYFIDIVFADGASMNGKFIK